MATDSVTLVLDGEVSLAAFANAIGSLHDLVTALSADTASARIEWVIDDLARGSTVATVRGLGEARQVERVVRAYEDVGGALEIGAPIKYSNKVKAAAQRLRAIPGGKINAVRFETADTEAIIRPAGRVVATFPGAAETVTPAARRAVPGTYGAVEGRIETLTRRGSLRFTLYDLLEDRAISCYLLPDHEEMMRDMWGRLAVVEGWISRDPETGRALSVRRISRVTPRPEPVAGAYREARGVAPSLSGLLPEHAIRRLRDDH